MSMTLVTGFETRKSTWKQREIQMENCDRNEDSHVSKLNIIFKCPVYKDSCPLYLGHTNVLYMHILATVWVFPLIMKPMGHSSMLLKYFKVAWDLWMPQMKQSKISTVPFSLLWLIYIKRVNNSEHLTDAGWSGNIFFFFFLRGRVMLFNHKSDMWTLSLWPVLSHLWEWQRSSFQCSVQYRSLHLGTHCCFHCHSREQALHDVATEVPQGP